MDSYGITGFMLPQKHIALSHHTNEIIEQVTVDQHDNLPLVYIQVRHTYVQR